MTPREKFNALPDKCKDCDDCILVVDYTLSMCAARCGK